MHRYKMVLCYDGTNYGGWQRQKNAPTIQKTIEEILLRLTGQSIEVVASGRTDAGVHALRQVAHFDCEKKLHPKHMLYSLNCLLPQDIRILSIEEAKGDFHARFQAKKKTYHYRIRTQRFGDPFSRKYTYLAKKSLDVELMKKACAFFVGTHDFTSFANLRQTSSSPIDNIRTIYQIRFVEEEGGFRIEYEGSGFLYKMVRNLTGTLLEVGEGRMDPELIPAILLAKDRKKGGKAAEAHALFLADVCYGSHVSSSKEVSSTAPLCTSSL